MRELERQDGPSGGEGIGRRSRRRADNHAVAAIAGEDFLIHADLQFDQARGGAAGDDEIIERELNEGLAAGVAAQFEQRARIEDGFAGPDLFERQRQLMGLHVGQEPQGTDIDAEQRGARPIVGNLRFDHDLGRAVARAAEAVLQ